MKKFIVIALSVGGLGNRIFYSGDKVTSANFEEGHDEILVKEGFIRPLTDAELGKEEKEAKAAAEKAEKERLAAEQAEKDRLAQEAEAEKARLAQEEADRKKKEAEAAKAAEDEKILKQLEEEENQKKIKAAAEAATKSNAPAGK